MSRRLMLVVLAALVAALAGAAPASARASVTKPKLSAAPVVGVSFTASGSVRPAATLGSHTAVKISLSRSVSGRWQTVAVYRARLRDAGSGTAYSRRLTVHENGRFAVRALQYRGGKLVARSAMTAFDVAPRVTIDPNVNGWDAPALRDTLAPAYTPLDVVFTTPADWASGAATRLNGAAHFVWGDFEQVDADGLIWHTDGLAPGRYDWMRDGMPKYGTGALVVTQTIDVDKQSHTDTHALAYLPADISFGDVSDAGMGCDRSIAFLTRVFTQTSADPLVWHSDGLVPGNYDWKCWMDDCHFGRLVVGDGADVAIDSDPLPDPAVPLGVVTTVSAGAPVDLVFSGTRMACWRTIHFTTASDLTKTVSYSAADPHVTWHSEGLAPGSYEWECWMGPQCHHGTIVVQ